MNFYNRCLLEEGKIVIVTLGKSVCNVNANIQNESYKSVSSKTISFRIVSIDKNVCDFEITMICQCIGSIILINPAIETTFLTH